MRKRRLNPRLVKIHRNYKVEEIARLFGIHKNTVRAWVKAELPISDGNRPMLILGQDLRAYLQECRTKNKQPCRPGELYCFHCRAPREPAGGMADCLAVTDKIGHLQAICPVCECIMNQRVSMAKLAEFRGKLDITFTEAQRRVNESNEPSVNSDLG